MSREPPYSEEIGVDGDGGGHPELEDPEGLKFYC